VHTLMPQSPSPKQRLLLSRVLMRLTYVSVNFGIELCWPLLMDAVAGLVGIDGGVVSGVINLESSGVEAPDWRPRHDEHYHEA
jgi:hypothetical protein